MRLATMSADDLAVVQNHTLAFVKGVEPPLIAPKQAYDTGGPLNTVAPAVTGTVTVGQVLTCAPGTWLNTPAFTYQWRWRGVLDIPGATAATYTLVSGDSGRQIECVVTGTNGAGANSTASNFVSVP